jgi:prefoldin subunit 5
VRLKQRATELGNHLVIEQQDRVIPGLALRIKSLEDSSTDAGLSVDELLSQLHSDLAEAESGLEEAREVGLPLAAKHLERAIADLKMRITALEGIRAICNNALDFFKDQHLSQILARQRMLCAE